MVLRGDGVKQALFVLRIIDEEKYWVTKAWKFALSLNTKSTKRYKSSIDRNALASASSRLRKPGHSNDHQAQLKSFNAVKNT